MGEWGYNLYQWSYLTLLVTSDGAHFCSNPFASGRPWIWRLQENPSSHLPKTTLQGTAIATVSCFKVQ